MGTLEKEVEGIPRQVKYFFNNESYTVCFILQYLGLLLSTPGLLSSRASGCLQYGEQKVGGKKVKKPPFSQASAFLFNRADNPPSSTHQRALLSHTNRRKMGLFPPHRLVPFMCHQLQFRVKNKTTLGLYPLVFIHIIFPTTTASRFRMLKVYSSFNFLHKFSISIAN